MSEGPGGLGDIGNGWNFFSGMEGVPFRTREGTVPLIKKDDPAHLQPKLSHDVQVKVFDLSDADDVKEYTEVLNFCARRLGRILEKETEYVKETNNWKVLVSWASYFWEDPAESSRQYKKYYNSNGG
jgi:hypothetical protein